MHGMFLIRVTALSLVLANVELTAARGEPVRIISFGDSTVAPRGAIRTYTDILREELANTEIRNAGVPGNTTADALRRLDADVRAHRPHIVIVQFGINDAAIDVWRDPPATAPRVPLDNYRNNLTGMIATLEADGTHVILVTPTPLVWTAKLKELYGKPPYDSDAVDGMDRLMVPYRKALEQIAAAEKIPLLDADAVLREESRRRGRPLLQFIPDGMHPNDDGHRAIADLIRDGILRLAAAEHLDVAPGHIRKPGESNPSPRPRPTSRSSATPSSSATEIPWGSAGSLSR